MNNRGQGQVGFWITSLVGIVVVITLYIVFEYVLYDPNIGLNQTMWNMGLNNSGNNQTLATLSMAWKFWPIAFVGAWIIAMIVRAIIREGDWGY